MCTCSRHSASDSILFCCLFSSSFYVLYLLNYMFSIVLIYLTFIPAILWVCPFPFVTLHMCLAHLSFKGMLSIISLWEVACSSHIYWSISTLQSVSHTVKHSHSKVWHFFLFHEIVIGKQLWIHMHRYVKNGAGKRRHAEHQGSLGPHLCLQMPVVW